MGSGGLANVLRTEARTEPQLVVCDSPEEFGRLGSAWNRLALSARTPFLTGEWLRSWWAAFGGGEMFVVALEDADGGLRAAATVIRRSGRIAGAAVNAYSEDWDVVADDGPAREALWRQIASIGGTSLSLPAVPAASASATIAPEMLRACGYRVAVAPAQASPYVELPESWDDLFANVSRNQRSQVRRKRKRLEGEGELGFKTTSGPQLDADLERFFRLEAAGWKGAAGTAILNDPRALRLFTEFAHAAADRGWLRLHFLELDGVTIAADYTCVLGDAAFLLKTAFDERYAKLSPGIVLRAEALRAAIDEGLATYEFLGGPDLYKLQWGGGLRERVLVRAYRGTALPAFVYRHRLRPLARRLLR